MKKIVSIIAFSSALIASGGVSFLSSCTNSKLDNTMTPQVRQIRQMNSNVVNVEVGDFRLQVLNDETVRFEYKYHNPIYGTYGWLDDDTLFVPNRTLYEGPSREVAVEKQATETIVTFGDIKIKIPNNIQEDMFGITVYQNEDLIFTTESSTVPDDNTGELPNPTPNDTGKVFTFVDYPRIIEPILGYSEANAKIEPYKSHWNKGLKENCGFEIQDHKDIYLTFPNNDAKKLRKQYRDLAGAPEMTRLSTLGAWDSRYYPYNEQTAQEEVDNYYKNDLPLDNLVIDTDWRAGFDGKGYFVNETLFPNMPRFLKSMHQQNLEVCFNDHPEPQKNKKDEELPVLDPKEVEFRRSNLDKILNMGLDTWWYDRNWSTSLICPGGKTDEHEKQLNHETWGDYLYNNVTKQNHLNHIKEKYASYENPAYERPTTMSNVVQIRNGEWKDEEGFTDSAAHRYSIQWTGDQNPGMLPSEIQNVVRTGIREMPYMSSDLAGHNQYVADDYYYQRWIEYGALSPIFRVHCTRDLDQHAQPWYRPEAVLNTFRNWIKLRYRLLPLYYSLAREAYETGLPICRALSFEYPNDANTYGMENEYLIGSNILFAPCTQPERDILEGDTTWGAWNGNLNVTLFNDTELEEQFAVETDLTDFSSFKDMKQFFINHGHPTGEGVSARIKGTFTPNQDRAVWLKSDDGVRLKIRKDNAEGEIVVDAQDWQSHSATYLRTETVLNKNQPYYFEIEYFNGTEGGSLEFAGVKSEKITKEVKEVYFPQGEWLDLFNGDVYESTGSGLTKTITCEAGQNALFIKLGTMIPLINNAQNTKEFNWNRMVYDVYPSKKTTIADKFESYLYEDDFETVAYQDGHYRKSPYSCYFDGTNFVINLDNSIGSYIGDKTQYKQFKLRLHKPAGINFGTITVNGDPAETQDVPADPETEMPFNFEGGSRTNDVVEILVATSPTSKYEIKIQLI